MPRTPKRKKGYKIDIVPSKSRFAKEVSRVLSEQGVGVKDVPQSAIMKAWERQPNADLKTIIPIAVREANLIALAKIPNGGARYSAALRKLGEEVTITPYIMVETRKATLDNPTASVDMITSIVEIRMKARAIQAMGRGDRPKEKKRPEPGEPRMGR